MITNKIKDDSPGFGGPWTNKKLDAFSKYVWSYLSIMKFHQYWDTIYFDGFAGSGENKKVCETGLYKQLSITPEEERIYLGSAERVLSIKDDLKFNYYYFIDLHSKNLEKLKSKISKYQEHHKNQFQYKKGNCNDFILQLSDAMKKDKNKYAALVFLDPFGMQIDWDSIASLKNTRTDIWILIPTGVIVNRLLDKSGKLRHIERLTSFFGMPEEELKSYFYSVQTKSTLFGYEDEIITKISKPIEKIAELYSERLKSIWKYVTEKPLTLTNSNNVPIFHFVFASNNANARKIANQIIGDKK